MSYFDVYKKRVMIDGETASDLFDNSTKQLINDSFKDSPTFSNIDIGGVFYDVRITDEERIDEKKLLFRPDTVVQVGDYATIGDSKWLILNFDSDRITPKSLIKKADRKLRWKDSNGLIIEEPCVVETVYYEEMRDGKFFFTPKGNLRVFTQYNSITKILSPEQRFIFGSSVYRVGGLDDFSHVYDLKGYFIINLEKTDKLATDDFTLGIADNSAIIKPSTSPTNGGDWL